MNKMTFNNMASKVPGTYDGVIPEVEEASVPEQGLIPIPSFNFQDTLCHFQSSAFKTQLVIVSCLANVHAECDKVAAMTLFNTNISKSVRLDEFQLMQTQASDYVQGHLRNTWQAACKNAVVNGLQNVGKGWFNMAETNQEVYEMSKLKKFMRMVKYIMQDALHSVVKVSFSVFCSML